MCLLKPGLSYLSPSLFRLEDNPFHCLAEQCVYVICIIYKWIYSTIMYVLLSITVMQSGFGLFEAGISRSSFTIKRTLIKNYLTTCMLRINFALQYVPMNMKKLDAVNMIIRFSCFDSVLFFPRWFSANCDLFLGIWLRVGFWWVLRVYGRRNILALVWHGFKSLH